MQLESYEDLVISAEKDNVSVIDYRFNSKRLKGLYSDGTIAVNNAMLTAEKKCVLAEELGHHYTSTGDITKLNSVSNIKQELHARAWAYDRLMNLNGIIDCYNAGCRNVHDMAERMDVTVDFIRESLAYYYNKYGVSKKVNDYVIFFEPLSVLKLI